MRASNAIAGVAVALAMALAACASAPAAPHRVDSIATLAAHRGDVVSLAGTREGPAKLGDFIAVDGEPVYFDAHAAGDVPYGAMLVLAGTLRRFEPPAAAGCGDGCLQADVPAHWQLVDARPAR